MSSLGTSQGQVGVWAVASPLLEFVPSDQLVLVFPVHVWATAGWASTAATPQARANVRNRLRPTNERMLRNILAPLIMGVPPWATASGLTKASYARRPAAGLKLHREAHAEITEVAPQVLVVDQETN
jgi:hypothetical protein